MSSTPQDSPGDAEKTFQCFQPVCGEQVRKQEPPDIHHTASAEVTHAHAHHKTEIATSRINMKTIKKCSHLAHWLLCLQTALVLSYMTGMNLIFSARFFNFLNAPQKLAQPSASESYSVAVYNVYHSHDVPILECVGFY